MAETVRNFATYIPKFDNNFTLSVFTLCWSFEILKNSTSYLSPSPRASQEQQVRQPRLSNMHVTAGGIPEEHGD